MPPTNGSGTSAAGNNKDPVNRLYEAGYWVGVAISDLADEGATGRESERLSHATGNENPPPVHLTPAHRPMPALKQNAGDLAADLIALLRPDRADLFDPAALYLTQIRLEHDGSVQVFINAEEVDAEIGLAPQVIFSDWAVSCARWVP
jgi:hypothetical protein